MTEAFHFLEQPCYPRRPSSSPPKIELSATPIGAPLKTAGYDIRFARNAFDAREQFLGPPQANLVIADIALPSTDKGTSGDDAGFMFARTFGGDVLVLLLTSWIPEIRISDALKAGASDVLDKEEFGSGFTEAFSEAIRAAIRNGDGVFSQAF